MRLAIVHDALVNLGGAERVVGVFHELFPAAPIYTTVYLPERTHASLRHADIRPGFLQHLARSEQRLKLLFPLAYAAMGRLDLSSYDVVLTSSTFCAKNVVTPAGTPHICYCYSAFRPAWEFEAYVAQHDWNRLTKAALRLFFAGFRRWDYQAAQRPHLLIAISQHAARKLERAYRRKPLVVYPPVDVARYPLASKSEDYFLVVSRLMPYKRIDVVVEAFNRLRYPLKIIGVGPDAKRLRALAGPQVEFVGAVSEETLVDYYARCRGLVFPGEEDFGLGPLEAHACGKPVIALARGGALETIAAVNDRNTPGRPARQASGLFFYEQTAEAVMEAVRSFETLTFSPEVCRERAWLFDKSYFQRSIAAILAQARVPCPGLETAKTCPTSAPQKEKKKRRRGRCPGRSQLAGIGFRISALDKGHLSAHFSSRRRPPARRAHRSGFDLGRAGLRGLPVLENILKALAKFDCGAPGRPLPQFARVSHDLDWIGAAHALRIGLDSDFDGDKLGKNPDGFFERVRDS